MGQTSSDRRDVFADWLLGVAEFTHAHWFFGNLYEAIVKIPDRVAASEARRELPRTPFGAGSPGRYYAPIAPLSAPAAVAALIAGWKHSDSRAWLMVGAASSATGAAATAYLLRSVNPKLFFSPQPLDESRRRPLLKRWYRVHALRLTASAVALAAIHQARTIRLRSHG
ncbi:DUF1772 domain-containing protein [Arthrobacter sp. B2a2-09]|uniref:DUF1772 domain-containing protein n=1 Tax=Arthrobacter sp. B2a2-09 TaxID=2952822 RepID=UPI0022CD41DA|nr:DUF1772 domain-containing protein [Arthrobacter sp. B2a2-09]MCZ9883773.1 DUF1772 domain-containing protein [Arthrobacter sp. B2a2-09]